MSRRKLPSKLNDDYFYYDHKKKSRTGNKMVKSVTEETVNVEDDETDPSAEAGSSNECLDDEDDDSMVEVDTDDSSESGITFEAGSSTPSKQRGRPPGKLKKKNPESGNGNISSEEEKWLDAIEEGRIEEDKTLSRMRDPMTMTARQKARVERPETSQDFSNEPVSLKPVLSAEQVERKAAKARERKKVADVKKEEEKRKTIEKLLLKRDDKVEPKKKQGRPGRSKAVNDIDRPWVASYSLHITPMGNFVSSPPGLDFPMDKQVQKKPRPPVHCGAPGCKNLKKYTCSKTQVPLCSLECYRSNITAVLKGYTAIS